MSSMTLAQQIITIGMCILGTMATRYLPFFIFKENKKTPEYIQYLGKFLPSAVFGMLVIYCLKNVEVLHGTHGIPEGISILVTAVLHIWKKNMFLSIAGGTICYMLILYFLFPVRYCTASRFLPYRTMSSIQDKLFSLYGLHLPQGSYPSLIKSDLLPVYSSLFSALMSFTPEQVDL